MKKYDFFLVVIMVLLPSFVHSQAFQFVVPEFYTNRIKTIDQFMERFNREETPTFLDSANPELPYMQVLSCFCIDSVRNQQNEVVEFVHRMVDSNVRLGFSVPNYFCELECNAIFNKKKTTVIMRMIIEQTQDGSYKWSIANAEGDVLRASPNRVSSNMRISPIDDDQYFLNLRDILNEHPEDISCYSYTGWTMDQTSSFMAFVANKMLKIESIKDMSYVFYIDGYEFKVRCLDRETNSNGWLICNLEKYYD